jgi:protein SCO1
MNRAAAFAFALGLLSSAADAALPKADLDRAQAAPPVHARFPLSLSALDLAGARRTMQEILAGRPAFLLFADYTCRTLCGPALVLLAAALADSNVGPDSYRLVVIGLDPKDTPDDARRMLAAQVPEVLRGQTVVLRPDERTLSAAAASLGFRYVYDESIDQFAHPEVVYALGSDGSVRRLLSPFDLTTSDLREALFAPEPDATVGHGVWTICYRLVPLLGAYSGPVLLALKVGSCLTVVIFLGAVLLMRRRTRPVP